MYALPQGFQKNTPSAVVAPSSPAANAANKKSAGKVPPGLRHNAWTTPTGLADGFGHQVALPDIQDSPHLWGPPFPDVEFGDNVCFFDETSHNYNHSMQLAEVNANTEVQRRFAPSRPMNSSWVASFTISPSPSTMILSARRMVERRWAINIVVINKIRLSRAAAIFSYV